MTAPSSSRALSGRDQHDDDDVTVATSLIQNDQESQDKNQRQDKMPPRGPQIPLLKRAAILALHWHGGKSWIEISMMLLVHPETARKICVRAKERATDPTSFDDVLQHLEDLERPGRKHRSTKVKKLQRANPRREIAEEHVRPDIGGEDVLGGFGVENFFRGGGDVGGEDSEQLERNHRDTKAGKLRVLSAADPEIEVGEPEEGGSKNYFENGGGYGGEGDGEFEWIE